MDRFLKQEKARYSEFKAKSASLSLGAKEQGVFFGKVRPFCVPEECAEENLFPAIREPILHYFADKRIKWHGGIHPSNHLCDSQICCANFLFPFADNPTGLAQLLRPIFPDLAEMLPMEDERFVALEWIGETDYLGEMERRRNKTRTRGANCTSVDAAVRFLCKNDTICIVLIEWKYCESYTSRSYKIVSGNGTNRVDIYKHLLEQDDCPIDKCCLKSLDDLFFEPFYQFMRQQLLAHEMEKAHEKSADRVTVLHIAPKHNTDFRVITSPNLCILGSSHESTTDIWKKLVRAQDKFVSVYTENLFGSFLTKPSVELQVWREYIAERYSWITDAKV